MSNDIAGKHLKQATKKATKSTFERAKMGAVIVKGGRVLSTGVNVLKFSKHTGREWPSIHAEEQAIIKLLTKPGGLDKLAGGTLYVSRVMKSGKTGLAKPCKHCQELINSVGIRKVVHT